MKESLEDYLRLMRGRYVRRTGRQGKGAVLDEVCETTGMERKYAIKVLGGKRRRERGVETRGRGKAYGAEDVELLKALWMAAGQPCGKRLAGEMLGMWLESWQRHHGRLKTEQFERIGGISAAQIDRLLEPYRIKGRRRRVGSAALAAMQREVALRCEPWCETGPGALEIDTVALCGGSMEGTIVWVLTATDIHSGWTEARAVWNRGAYATHEQLLEIEQALPFAIRKLDFDNGSEFLNGHFLSYFRKREPKVELSRSRPYRKNDNAHIEQKNYTHVRQLLGDDRFAHEQLLKPLNEVLELWSRWNNLFCAQRRLVSKERGPDGKVRRKHEKAASSPLCRLQGHASTSEAQRLVLARLRQSNDPIDLRTKIETKLTKLYRLRAKLQRETDAPAESKKPSGPAAVRFGVGDSSLRSPSRLRRDELPPLIVPDPKSDTPSDPSLP